MKKESFANQSPDHLRELLARERERVLQLRQERLAGKLSDTTQIPAARRQIARILTALRLNQ